jgi:hypothetical protein
MTTEAQIEANRINAQKSTGPRTPEGKATVAQNAVKHGLLARTAVLHGEDWEEYTCFSEELLDELYPDGVMEQELANRVVDLSWRLRRAALSQNAIFEALYDQYVAEHAGEPLPVHGPEEGVPPVGAPLLGRMMVADFAGDRVLERMLGYERRIESSLCRIMGDYRKLRAEHRAARPGLRPSAGASLPDDHPIWGRSPKRWTPPAGPDAAGKAGRDPQPVSIAGRDWKPPGSDRLQELLDEAALLAAEACDSDTTDLPQDQGQLCQTNPICGSPRGTGILPVIQDHGQDAHATPSAAFCQTKPIGSLGERQVLGGQEVTAIMPQGGTGRAEPEGAGYRPVHCVGRPTVRSY